MAEGGIAAALGNVDDRDNWKVHFADTMRGGQYVNNWRMAELHAKEAPDRVRELEAWGAVFDRTQDGRILQRNFGGHRYPRLAHVGDRTGLEMIRTLQDHGIHQGIDVHMECTVLDAAAWTATASPARSATTASAAASTCSAPRRSCSPPAASAAPIKITSNSWEYTGDGHALAYHAGAELIDMEFVQFHPTGHGLAAERARASWSPKACAAKAACCANSEGRRFMFDDIPDNYKPQTADNEEEGWRYTQGDKNARRPPELLTRDHVARCIMREVQGGPRQPARRRVPRHRLDQGEAARTRAEHIKKKLPSMYHQFKQLADIDITKEPMEVGPTTHYIMGGVRVDARHADVDACPGCSPPASAPPGMHGANRLGGNSLSDLLVFGKRAGEYAAAVRASATARRRDRRRPGRRARPSGALAPFERGAAGENPYQVQHDLQDMMQDLVGIVRTRGRDAARRSTGSSELQRARRDASASRATASTTRAGTRRSICATC